MSINSCVKVMIGSLLSLILLSDGVSVAQIASALLREGEPLPGDMLGTSITGIGNSAQNSVGGYAFTVTTDSAFSHVWGNATGGTGAVIRSESTIGIFEQTSFESFFGMSDLGSVGYSAITNNTSSGQTGLDGMWVDTTLTLNEDDPISDLIGEWSTFNSRPGVTCNGLPYWVGGYADTRGGATQNRAMFFNVGSNILIKGGDPISGLIDPAIVGSAVDFDFRLSAFGAKYISPIIIDSGSTTNDVAMVSNGVAMSAGGSIIREGFSIPAAAGGLAGELYSSFDFVGISETGNYMITGDSNAASTEDEFVMIDGMIVLREGDSVGGMTLNGSIEGGFFNEDGDWAVIWDVDTTSGNVEALVLNGQLVLMEGDLVDWNGDGIIDGADQNGFLTDFTGISVLTLGFRDENDNVDLCFTADCNVDGNTLEAGFRMTVDVSGRVTVLVDSFDVTRGDYVSGTVGDLVHSDNNDVSGRRKSADTQSRVFVEFRSTSPTATPTRFDLTFEASVFARSTVVQSLDLFDYQGNDWEVVNVRDAARFVDMVTIVSPAGDLSRFVEPGTQSIEARVRFQSASPRQRFSANIDQVIWTISP